MSLDNFDFKGEIEKEIRKTFFGENPLSIYNAISNKSFQKLFELLEEQMVSYGSYKSINYIAFIQEFGAEVNNDLQAYFKSNEFKESDFIDLKKNYEILLRSVYYKAIADEYFEEAIDFGYFLKGFFGAFKKVYLVELVENLEKLIHEIDEEEIKLKQRIEDNTQLMYTYFIEPATETINEVIITPLEQELIKAGLIGANCSNVAPMPLHPISKKSTEYLYQNTKMDWLGERIALLYLFNLVMPNSLQDTRLKINHFISKYYTFKGESITVKQVEKLKSYLISQHINNAQKLKPDFLLKIEEIVGGI